MSATPRTAGVRAAQSEAAAGERRAAIRRLLVRPLLGQREDPDVYAAVVRHRDELVGWFAEHTGWQLVVDPSGGFARLHKTDPTDDDTRPALAGRAARPFDRRRYTLLCLALAALDERRGQTTLRHVAEAVAGLSAEQPGVDAFDAARMPDRRALVDALKLLVDLGVLSERDGDSDRYALSGGGDALYDVDDRRLGQLVSAPASPSLVSRPEDLPVEVYPDSDEGRRLRARHRVMRRILEEPVVYYDELDAAEEDWLRHSLGHVHDLCDRDVGLLVERRAEGLAAVDADREVTDETFPDGNSTVKHAALLLAEQLAGTVRAERRERPGEPAGETVVTDAEVNRLVAGLLDAYGERCGWSAAYRERPDGAAVLAADALALLRRFRLVERRDPPAPQREPLAEPVPEPAAEPRAEPMSAAAWAPRPAIARFAPAAPRTTAPRQTSLLGEEPLR